MDKLEQYIEQVCKSIGGPFDLRQHVRQELREHLVDAVAQHKAAGLSEADAVAKALDEFGKPEEVRSELEAAYGKRMTWILDKTMQWKERTMKAKWLWMTVAHVSVVLVIMLGIAWISFANVFLVPKFQKLHGDGYIDPITIAESDIYWTPGFLDGVHDFFAHSVTWFLLLAIALIGLFEWRVKSENKPWIRLSGLGTVAVGALLLGILMAGSLIIPYMLAVPAMGKMARPWALEQVDAINLSSANLDNVPGDEDWEAASRHVEKASVALTRLTTGPTVISLLSKDSPLVNELRESLKAAQEDLKEVRQAVDSKDAKSLRTHLEGFHKSIEPVRQAAGKRRYWLTPLMPKREEGKQPAP